MVEELVKLDYTKMNCQSKYDKNVCWDPVPYSEEKCLEWDIGRNKPSNVKMLNVVALYVSGALNAFASDLKLSAFVLIGLVVLVVVWF